MGSLAGMSVAFPVGVGLALVLGVFINYFGAPNGDPVILFAGVALVVIAIIAGILLSFFYRFVASAMDLNNFESQVIGMLTPYGAFFIFAIGIFVSNFIFNSLVMKRPFVGSPVNYSQYFKGNLKAHSVGFLGGIIWGVGTVLSYIAAGKAGPAISYALGQGAPMIATFWGIFIWKEFKGSSKTVNYMLIAMFIIFITALSFIVASGGN